MKCAFPWTRSVEVATSFLGRLHGQSCPIALSAVGGVADQLPPATVSLVAIPPAPARLVRHLHSWQISARRWLVHSGLFSAPREAWPAESWHDSSLHRLAGQREAQRLAARWLAVGQGLAPRHHIHAAARPIAPPARQWADGRKP